MEANLAHSFALRIRSLLYQRGLQSIRCIIAALLVWLLLLRIVFPCMDSSDVAKIEALVQHFYEHTVLDATINWWTFLLEHYTPSSDHQSSSDHTERHHQLPLHCLHTHTLCFTALGQLDPVYTGIERPLYILAPPYTPQHFYIFYTSIFQPPKLTL
ncbi:MAG: hypothetical protein RML40_06835 [Bacteroidota bacterium]|nr:hypothetical protein [Candidatus Kapabacteria bacterium]MDW8220232.1 hypothetical protein [Bacteroidota bacterium]